MARSWKSRPTPPPTSITEIARRYHAAAVALAQTLGLSVPEVLAQHRESVTAIFIECGKCEIRLPVGIKLPPLAALPADSTIVEPPERPPVHPSPNGAGPPHVTAVTSPTAIPTDAGLPCAGQAIPALTPPQLAMLISKTARLLQGEGERWVALLHALERERNARLAKGQRGTGRPAGAHGDVP